MLSQRILQQSARRLTARPRAFIAPRFASPASILLQVRPASINSTKAQPTSTQDGLEILVAQRLNRPVAPHLSIYKPQISWILSSLHRVTGIMLSGPLYLFALAYLAAPVLGINLSTAAMVAALAKWPVAIKFLGKFVVGGVFSFKSLQGVRHLVWDTGRMMTNQAVIRSGWTVVALSGVCALVLAVFV